MEAEAVRGRTTECVQCVLLPCVTLSFTSHFSGRPSHAEEESNELVKKPNLIYLADVQICQRHTRKNQPSDQCASTRQLHGDVMHPDLQDVPKRKV